MFDFPFPKRYISLSNSLDDQADKHLNFTSGKGNDLSVGG